MNKLEKLDSLSEHAKSLCDRMEQRLAQFNFKERRLALQALHIRVVVNGAAIKLYGTIQTNLATIEQTSGCVLHKDVVSVPFCLYLLS